MKKIIQVCSVLVLAIVFSVVSTWAQSSHVYRADIPFDFNIDGKYLPAGSYSVKINKVPAGSAVITLVGSHGGGYLPWALAMPTGESVEGKSVLRFLRLGDDRYLDGILTPDGGVLLTSASAKRKPGERITAKAIMPEAETVALN